MLYTIWTNTEEYEAFSPLDSAKPSTRARPPKDWPAQAAGSSTKSRGWKTSRAQYERVSPTGTVQSLTALEQQRDGRWRTIRVRLPRHPAAVARGKRGYNAR